jgi:hypothetical protein
LTRIRPTSSSSRVSVPRPSRLYLFPRCFPPSPVRQLTTPFIDYPFPVPRGFPGPYSSRSSHPPILPSSCRISRPGQAIQKVCIGISYTPQKFWDTQLCLSNLRSPSTVQLPYSDLPTGADRLPGKYSLGLGLYTCALLSLTLPLPISGSPKVQVQRRSRCWARQGKVAKYPIAAARPPHDPIFCLAPQPLGFL